MKTEKFQSVWITFSDGTKAGFSGKAVVFPGDARLIRDISFTAPQDLDPGYSFEVTPKQEGTKRKTGKLKREAQAKA